MARPRVEVGRWGEEKPRQASDPKDVLSRLEALAWLLDSSIPLPGIGYRIGLESLLGLIPLLGDALGALFSSYILFVAARLGVPRVTLLRMGFNVTVEAVVGVIPLAGDLFDFAWKANRRNVELLRAHERNPARARRGDWLFAALLMLLVLAILGLCGWAAFSLGRFIWNHLAKQP